MSETDSKPIDSCIMGPPWDQVGGMSQTRGTPACMETSAAWFADGWKWCITTFTIDLSLSLNPSDWDDNVIGYLVINMGQRGHTWHVHMHVMCM